MPKSYSQFTYEDLFALNLKVRERKLFDTIKEIAFLDTEIYYLIRLPELLGVLQTIVTVSRNKTTIID